MNIKMIISTAATLGALFTGSTQADTWQYTLTGTFSNSGSGNASNVAITPDIAGKPFELAFLLDDSVSASQTGALGSGNYYARFPAISNWALNIEGQPAIVPTNETVTEFIATNHQWSVFTSQPSAVPSVMPQTIQATTDNQETLDLDLKKINLIMVDTDGDLFTQGPPELVAVSGTEFENKYLYLQWSGWTSGNQANYNYSIQGNINDISISAVSAVPVPAAAWLFGSTLIGMLGWSRRLKIG